MPKLDSAHRPEEIWKAALGFLLLELSADRAVVLDDEEGSGEFAAVAARGLDPDAVLGEDGEIDLDLLRSAGRGRSPVAGIDAARGRCTVAVPLTSSGGGVTSLLYADRRQASGPFGFEELRLAAGFAEEAGRRLAELRPAMPAVNPLQVHAPPEQPPLASELLARPPGPAVPHPGQETPSAPEPLPPMAVPVGATAPAPSAGAQAVYQSPVPPPAAQAPPAPSAVPARRAPRISRISAPFELHRPQGEDLSRANLVAGRFAVQREFLRCRFSTLVEAVDRRTGTPLVLRRLEVDPATGPEARRQLLAEGRLLSRLRHRNLPRVLEIIEDGGRIDLVLEEFSGRTLGELMAEAPEGLPAELVRRYLEQLLEALDYLHRQSPPIVHRDLQPDTLLVTEHGVLKLAEFGLARMQEPAAQPKATAFRSLGSACYGAPEQLVGEPSHPGNDLYSAGALAFFLATGKAPAASVDRAMGGSTEAPLGDLRPDLDRTLVEVVRDLMCPVPEGRPRSAAEARMRLAQEAEEPLERSETQEAEESPARREAAAEVLSPQEAPQIEITLEPTSEEPRAGPAEPSPGPRPSRSPGSDRKGLMAKLGSAMSAWKVMLGGRSEEQPASAPGSAAVQILEVEPPETPTIDLASTPLDREIARTLPELVSRSVQGLCIGVEGGNLMVVAVADPNHIYVYDHVSIATRGQYRATLRKADPKLLELAMEYVYRSSEASGSISWLEWLERKKLTDETLEVMNPMADIALGLDEITSPIVAAVDRIVKEAISAGASDIHLETYELGVEVRYRIDGVLHPIDQFPPREASAMVKRLKVMANMDIAQERIPQGGRISLKVGGHELDLRVSIIPVPNGESIVMRLLKKGAFNLTLPDLGFSNRTLDRFRHILSQPYGMILSCGPTGSGKSTTLYASLKEIQRPDRKLLTVEDPIEYQMPGICQVQVNTAPREEEKKVTFARVLREFLRQDPDVILVGEIRDTETASIAVQAALTGHLLLSTIHTNDSVGIIARLRDMGIEQFLIGSTLLGGLAQRLSRRICKDCREEVEVPPVALELFEREGVRSPRMFHGVGCRTCHGTGYRGRVGLYELLEITPEVRAQVNRGAPEEEIRRIALSQGFRALFFDGLEKVVEGQVTLEEVQRVCKTL